MAASVTSWAAQARSSTSFKNVESQKIVDIYEELLESRNSPEGAADEIMTVLRPIIDADPTDIRVMSVWSVFCDAVRTVSSKKEAREQLLQLLISIQKIELKDEHGNAICYAWGGKLWSDLPTFGAMFREYAIDIESDEEISGEEWLEQATPVLNATLFASSALAYHEDWEGMAFHVPIAMNNMCNSQNNLDTPEPQYRLEMFVPCAAAWIEQSGRTIYELCEKGARYGMTLDGWKHWKSRAGEIASSVEVQSGIKDKARAMFINMAQIDGDNTI